MVFHLLELGVLLNVVKNILPEVPRHPFLSNTVFINIELSRELFDVVKGVLLGHEPLLN